MPFIAGIFLSRDIHGMGTWDRIWLLCLLLFAFFLFLMPFFSDEPGDDTKSASRGWLPPFILCLSFSLLLGLAHFRAFESVSCRKSANLLALADDRMEHVFTGVVLDAPVPVSAGCRTRILILTEDMPSGSRPILAKMAVTFGSLSWREIEPGEWIRFAARLREVRNFGTPGTFDFENWWALRGIRVKAYCGGPLKVARLGQGRQDIPLFDRAGIFIQRSRFNIIMAITRTTLKGTRGPWRLPFWWEKRHGSAGS